MPDYLPPVNALNVEFYQLVKTHPPPSLTTLKSTQLHQVLRYFFEAEVKSS